MSWGPIIKCEAPCTPEEAREREEARRAGKLLQRLGLLLACGVGFVTLEQCAAIGASVAECPPSESGLSGDS
jgi:hypothetical protein